MVPTVICTAALMEKSRIPVCVRKDDVRFDKRPPASSSPVPLPGCRSAEEPTGKELLPGPPQSSSAKQPTCTDERLSRRSSSPYPSPEMSSAERPTDKHDKRLLSSSLFDSLHVSNPVNWPTEKRPLPNSSSSSPPGSNSTHSLLGPAQSSSAEHRTDNQLLAEQTNIAGTDGRQTGHHFAHNVAKDNSRVHYGDNYNATHYHNYKGPYSDSKTPRNLEDARAKGKVPEFMADVMGKLSFERMGLRKGTIAPALINTCQWLLASPEYINWRDPDRIHDHHGFMWIKSKAGAGKSTAMKFMLESTLSQHAGDIAISFFFNARGDETEKTLNGLYRHLLHQLLFSVSRIQYTMVDDVKKLASQGWQLSTLKELFRTAVLNLQSERFTCFIDALDESSEDEIQDMIDFFEELGNDVVTRHIDFHVCFSSRHYPNVELEKCQYLNLDNKSEHENDIALYIRSKLKPRAGGISDDLLNLVQKKAQGVFLWAVLVTQILKKDYQRGDIHKARGRLESIPPGLHNLFRDMIQRNVEHPNDNKDLVCILQWIAFARQPLTPQDIYYAVRSEDPDFHISHLWTANGVNLETMKLFILNCSKGLAELTTSHQKPTVQCIHESVRNFLQEAGFDILTPGRGIPLLGFAHNNLKRCCLRWITISLHEQLSIRLLKQSRVQAMGTEDIPLLSYSINNMIEHAEIACINGVPQDDFVESFPVKVWVIIARSDAYPYTQTYPASLIEIFAYHHVNSLLAIELRRIGSCLLSSQYESALRLALTPNAMTTFEFLLSNGAPSYNVEEQQAETMLLATNSSNVAARVR